MSLHKVSLFVWSILLQQYYYYIITCIGWCITMLLTDRNFNTSFYDQQSGDPILYQHYSGSSDILKFIS